MAEVGGGVGGVGRVGEGAFGSFCPSPSVVPLDTFSFFLSFFFTIVC